MATKENPGEFDCHAKAQDDEPLFTLLARDPTAPFLVGAWAHLQRGNLIGALSAMRVAVDVAPKHDLADAKANRKLSEAVSCMQDMLSWRERRVSPRGEFSLVPASAAQTAPGGLQVFTFDETGPHYMGERVEDVFGTVARALGEDDLPARDRTPTVHRAVGSDPERIIGPRDGDVVNASGKVVGMFWENDKPRV